MAAPKPHVTDENRSFPDVASVAMGLAPSYPIYCVRPSVLEANTRRFISLFPGTVLFAVKCNPHPSVLDAIHRGGVRHFDTASLPEIAQIAERYSDASAYFMHPVKARAVIKAAYSIYGVRTFTIDHASELEKIIEETGGEGLTIVVRLKTPPIDGTLYHLAEKFGAETGEAADLVKAAAKRGCKTGICFHVGSQCSEPAAYRNALAQVGEVIEASSVQPTCIDVGGGFPSSYANMVVPPLEDFMVAIREGLSRLDLKPEVAVWAEPGRALVATGCSLLVQVQLRKKGKLYINDGIYGSLSELVQGGIELPTRLIRIDGPASVEFDDFTLNGPTCDSLDVLPGTYKFPEDVREGDWIEIDHVGAYSNAMATHFNGFHPETFIEVHGEPPELAEERKS